MSKAQTDIRTTSYDVATANPVGYIGTIDDALAQIRAEQQFPVTNRGRAELLHFLGVDKPLNAMSGIQAINPTQRVPRLIGEEDDSVEYGAPVTAVTAPSPYSLEHAMQRWPQNFKQ